MTQALAELIAVHIILLFLRYGRIILFPEGHGPALKHTSPIFPDTLQHLLQIPHLTQGIHFIELKVGCSDLRYRIIVEHILYNLYFLSSIRDIKQDGKNIGMSRHMFSS